MLVVIFDKYIAFSAVTDTSDANIKAGIEAMRGNGANALKCTVIDGRDDSERAIADLVRRLAAQTDKDGHTGILLPSLKSLFRH